MRLLTEAMNGLGPVLLQVVALLAIEELTFGGLVRLFLAPLPGSQRNKEQSTRKEGSRCLR